MACAYAGASETENTVNFSTNSLLKCKYLYVFTVQQEQEREAEGKFRSSFLGFVSFLKMKRSLWDFFFRSLCINLLYFRTLLPFLSILKGFSSVFPKP